MNLVIFIMLFIIYIALVSYLLISYYKFQKKSDNKIKEKLTITVLLKKYNRLILLLIIIILLVIIFNSRWFKMTYLPKGEYIESLYSPNYQYVLNSYRFSGGATMDWSVRVEVVNKKTGKKENVYWKYHEDNIDMKWIDDENVEINGIKLNIHKDYYKKY